VSASESSSTSASHSTSGNSSQSASLSQSTSGSRAISISVSESTSGSQKQIQSETLPNTGQTASVTTALLGTVLGLAGASVLGRRKREDEE